MRVHAPDLSELRDPHVSTTASAPLAAPSYREVVARLSGAQKSSRGAPAYARWVNRRLGRYLAAWAFLRGMTPNQVTSISASFTFSAIALIALVRPAWWVGVLAALMLLTGYAFDSADGQLARLRGGGSPAGEWLDHVIDCVKCSSLHLAVLISWYRFFHLSHAGYLLIPLGYSLVSAVFFFGVILSEQLRKAVLAERGEPPVAASSVPAPALRSFLVLPWDYGLVCMIFFALGYRSGFIVLYTLMGLANLGLLAIALLRWFREMGELGAPRGPVRV